MIKRIALIVVLAITAGPGCWAVGRDIKKSSVSGIERGVTTKAQVRESLGEPQYVSITPTGEVWSYRYMRGMSYGESWAALLGAREYGGTNKMLVIIFDGDRVKDYSYTESK